MILKCIYALECFFDPITIGFVILSYNLLMMQVT